MGTRDLPDIYAQTFPLALFYLTLKDAESTRDRFSYGQILQFDFV